MIIALLGQAGAGKDTVADHLAKAHQGVKIALADPLKRYCQDAYDFTDDQLWGPSSSRNRADERYPREHTFKLKGACNECLCCGYVWKDSLVPPPPSFMSQCFLTPRYALQLLGTEFGRHCYSNTWIQKGVRVAQQLLADPDARYDRRTGVHRVKSEGAPIKHVIISDVRFRNEMTAIQNAGGKVWRIVPQASKEGSETWRAHQSEAEQLSIPDSEFDAVIVNAKVAFEVLYADVDRALQQLC